VLKPTPFGKYYLLERINVGGMAEVFKAKAFGVEGFERLFAVKKILPAIAADQDFIDMFIDEAKIAVQLNHANIAQTFDLGRVNGAYFIALEYISGKDLRTLFEHARKQQKAISIPQACFMVMQICEGLDYAHNKRDAQGAAINLVHRDISPQNVLISYEGECKIIDFGIVKAAGRASKTQAGILKGKFGYMSPEQVRGLPLDRRSDIFSLGILLYELLTMERLFYAESDFSILEKIRNVEIGRPTEYNPEIPPELEDIVLRALSRDSKDRFQTAAEFHDALQSFMFRSGLFYTRKDLAAYMHSMFASDIQAEQSKLELYRSLVPPPEADVQPPPPPPPPPQAATPWGPLPAFPRPPAGNGVGGYGHAGASMTAAGVLAGAGSPEGAGPHPGPLPGPLPPGASPSGPFVAFGASPSGGYDAVASSPPPQAFAAPAQPERRASGLEWDEEEAETTVYERGGRGGRASDPFGLALSSEPSLMTGPEPLSPAPAKPEAPGVPSPPPQGGKRRSPTAFLVGFTLLALLGAAVVAYLALNLLQRSATVQLATLPPDGVAVELDGQAIHEGLTPIQIKDLSPGRHVILVRRKEFQEQRAEFDLARGEVRPLEITLQPAPDARSRLRLSSEPAGARISLDGERRREETPVLLEGLPPGRHRVRLDKPGFRDWEEEIELQAGLSTERQVELRPATVTLSLQTQPHKAVYTLLFADGDSRSGSTPARIEDLPWGASLKVKVEQSGFEPKEQELLLQPESGDEVELSLRLEARTPAPAARPTPPPPRRAPPARRPTPPHTTPPAPVAVTPAPAPSPAPAAAEPGLVSILARPQAEVWIDGRRIKWTPLLNYKLAPGPHAVTLVNDNFGARKTLQINLQPGQRLKLPLMDWNVR